VEVIRLTGKKFRTTGQLEGRRQKAEAEVIFALTRRTDDLHARINIRVDEMFRRGWWMRARIARRGLEQNQTAMQAIGYGSSGAFARRAGAGGNHRAGENPHTAICQAAIDVFAPA